METFSDRHSTSTISEVLFIDYGIDKKEDSKLVLNIENEFFQIYKDGKEIAKGKMEHSDIVTITSLIGNIEISDLNRIFNVNSADASLFMIKFWGVNTDYAYMLESYGTTNLPDKVGKLFKAIRKNNKDLGRR